MAGLIAHEWLAPTGGSENVVEAFTGLFPDAELWCLWDESNGRFTNVNETWLARTPLKGRKAFALPLMPLAWRTLPSRESDWVLTSSHVFAHHAKFGGSAGAAPKFVYAHTPARYVWVPELDGRGSSFPARMASSLLKPTDRKRAAEPIAVAANSRFVAKRIEDAWQRTSTVIYPPVDVAAFGAELDPRTDMSSRLPDQFLLGISRFVPYKRLDLVIEAGRASGLPVVIAGSGPAEDQLRAMAEARHPGRVTFVRRPSFDVLRALYRRASVVVFPPIEDFGIIPVEAMASGTVVIGNALGGASESIIDGVTGVLVNEWSGEELRKAVERATELNSSDAIDQAAQFSTSRFGTEVIEWMRSHGAPVTHPKIE